MKMVRQLFTALLFTICGLGGKALALDLMLPYSDTYMHVTRAYNESSHRYYSRWADDRYAIDFAKPGCGSWDEPVRAAESGTVESSARNLSRDTSKPGYGNFVMIRHAGGYRTRYAHLHRVYVRNNEKVKKGEIIGTVGNSGNTHGSSCPNRPGTHLHFAVYNSQGYAFKPEPISSITNVQKGRSYWASAPVYRFWSDRYRSHFYTKSEGEKTHLIMYDNNWRYEGEAFHAFSPKIPGSSPVYRFYSPQRRSHFYTISVAEKNAVLGDGSWKYEGVAYHAFTGSGPQKEPLYRFWNRYRGNHFYTASAPEKNHLISNSHEWVYEGIAYYILKK